MEKTLEPQFAEVQAGMVSICLEYCEGVASEVYIVVVYYDDDGAYSFESDFFFRIRDKLHKKIALQNDLGDGIGNVPKNRLYSAIKMLNGDVKKLILLCKEHNQPMPNVMKLVYDVKTGKLEADYKYKPVKDLSLTISEKWMVSIEGK